MSAIDTELSLQNLLETRKVRRTAPAHEIQTNQSIQESLEQFFSAEQVDGKVSGVNRIGGGASKEQFLFNLTSSEGSKRCLLRMDPTEAITETDRHREFEILNAIAGTVPVPKPLWMDRDARFFPREAVVMEFLSGVTKPSDDAEVKVSGLGTHLGPRLRDGLKQQFLDYLVAIHNFDWQSAKLRTFEAPNADLQQAARWQVEYFAELMRQDDLEHAPIVALTEAWLRHNIPACESPVLVHGDYRTGNFLFNEDSCEITAILDWELAYLGDFHDDLSWVLQRVFGTLVDGVFRAGDLFEREEFITAYEDASGRSVNRTTLHFYEVFAAYKCYLFAGASGLTVSKATHTHQDVLLTFLAGASPLFKSEMCRLLREQT